VIIPGQRSRDDADAESASWLMAERGVPDGNLLQVINCGEQDETKGAETDGTGTRHSPSVRIGSGADGSAISK